MMRHLVHRLGLFGLAVVVSLYGCGGSSSDISGDRSGRATSPEKKRSEARRALENTSSDVRRSVLNDNERNPTEGPAWLAEALDDPDSTVRIWALEAWAQHPEENLDPLTHVLVDPDESVRVRAQELLEEELARR